MTKTIIKPDEMAEAVGPFPRAVMIEDHLYIAGMTALSHISSDYYERHTPKGIEKKTRLTLDNIRKCVEAAGGTMNGVRADFLYRTADQHKLSGVTHARRCTDLNSGVALMQKA